MVNKLIHCQEKKIPPWVNTDWDASIHSKSDCHSHLHLFRDRKFNGHLCRMAEGRFGGFFGWPNLTLTPTGGFMGMPGSDRPGDMRVIDMYRREGDKLAENWVFIDLLHFWNQQGLDVLGRMQALSR